MAQELCAICHERPAVARVSLVQNGQRRELALCELHYRQLMRQQRMRSPLESLFGGGSPFDEIFSGFGEQSPVTPVRAREPEAVDIAEYFSKQTTEYLQRAAQVAAEFGKREVDTEHLLYALADADVVQAVLKQFGLSPADLKQYIEGQRRARRQQERGERGHDHLAAGEERLAARLRPVPRTRPQLCRPRAPVARPGGGAGQLRRDAPESTA